MTIEHREQDGAFAVLTADSSKSVDRNIRRMSRPARTAERGSALAKDGRRRLARAAEQARAEHGPASISPTTRLRIVCRPMRPAAWPLMMTMSCGRMPCTADSERLVATGWLTVQHLPATDAPMPTFVPIRHP
jgi:hypothetical protein